MSSARFLVVALSVVLWGVAGCASSVYRQRPERTFRVSGYVLDSISRKSVAQVLVQSHWHQVLTDSTGHFAFTSTDRDEVYAGMPVTVHTTYYDGQRSLRRGWKKANDSLTILLHRNRYRFKPYGCQQLADSARISPYAAASIESLPGCQYAFLIRDTTIHQPRKLRAVSFRVGHNAFPREPFRIRIYRCKDYLEEPPREDLLLESIMVCPVKEGVITCDVGSYDIMVAGSGFYLALEPIISSDKFFCADSTVAYKPSGPILRPPCARADIRTWEYVIGKGWHRATAVENCWPLYESALSVEVEPALTPPTRR